jgi:hypothetical protein
MESHRGLILDGKEIDIPPQTLGPLGDPFARDDLPNGGIVIIHFEWAKAKLTDV